MVPTVVLVKNECCEPRLEINEKSNGSLCPGFFYATIVSFTRPPTATPLCVGGNSPTHSIFSNI